VTTFSGRWAQVSYFLASNGDFTRGTQNNPNGLRLYDLYRRVQPLVPLVATQDTTPLQPFPPYPTDNPDLSTTTGHGNLTRAGHNATGLVQPEVTQPRFRFGMFPGDLSGMPYAFDADGRRRPPTLHEEYNFPYMASRWGDDVLLTDVVSFEIKAVWEAKGPNPTSGNGGTWNLPGMPPNYPNTDAPFDYLPLPQWSVASQPPNSNTYYTGQNPPAVIKPSNQQLLNQGYRVFDTWSSVGPYANTTPFTGWNNDNPNNPACIPLRVRIKALQIRITVWDRKSEQTRQITIVQDM
jgi:hypothetical protein